MFRGREITHKELGQAILDDVVKDLKEVAVVEQTPRMEGRQMFMILAPNPKVAQRARELAGSRPGRPGAPGKPQARRRKPEGDGPAARVPAPQAAAVAKASAEAQRGPRAEASAELLRKSKERCRS